MVLNCPSLCSKYDTFCPENLLFEAVLHPRQDQGTIPSSMTPWHRLIPIISMRKMKPFDPLKLSVVSLQKRYNPTLNLRDFHRMRMGFTAAASASAHVCLLTCCKKASRSIRAEKDGTSGITLLSFPAAYTVLTGHNIYHEAFFFFIFPHDGPHVCLSAELIAPPVTDKHYLWGAHNLWRDWKSPNKAEIEFK